MGRRALLLAALLAAMVGLMGFPTQATAEPNLGNDSIQYRLPGVINGRSGVYEIFTRPSTSGRTEMIIHRFRPDY